MLTDAARKGKAIGAPALGKALKKLDPEKLTKREQKKLRDAFEGAPLTPKARELAEKLLKGDGGIKKFRADEPIRTEPPIRIKPPIVKVMADDPSGA
jgi:hypothetical protein